MTTFTGNDVRELRKKHRLSRFQLAQILDVSPVTIEKWEQAEDKEVRGKYHDKLLSLGGYGLAAGVIGVLAAPALLPVAGIAALGGFGSALTMTDSDIDKTVEWLHQFKKLTPEEREMAIKLNLKMKGYRQE